MSKCLSGWTFIISESLIRKYKNSWATYFMSFLWKKVSWAYHCHSVFPWLLQVSISFNKCFLLIGHTELTRKRICWKTRTHLIQTLLFFFSKRRYLVFCLEPATNLALLVGSVGPWSTQSSCSSRVSDLFPSKGSWGCIYAQQVKTFLVSQERSWNIVLSL